MNVLFVTDLYPLKNDETIPFALKDFALMFKEFGHNVEVVRPNLVINSLIRKHKILKEDIYFENDIKIYNKNFLLPFLNSNIDFLEEKYDLIISHMPCGNIYASLINKKLKLPHIAIVHQSDEVVLTDLKYKFYFKNRLKKALLSADIIGARNKSLKEKLNADFILPSYVKKEDIVEKKEFINKKIKFVTLSKLIKRKNIDKTIKALSKVNFDFEFDIYGKGVEEKRLKKLIQKLKLDKKVFLKGQISHDKVLKTLDNYDCFILVSLNETFGISYTEALSRGLIAVGKNNTGIDGIIKDGFNGFLVEKDIVKVLEKVKNCDKDLISKNAIQTANELTKEKIYEKYLEIIKKISS